MRRKLIELSRKTFVVTLPVSWLNDHHLKKGDEVDFFVRGSSLIVEPLKRGKVSASVVDISDLNASLVWHAIVSRYIRGFEQIELHFKNDKVFDPRSGKNIPISEVVDHVIDVLEGMNIVSRSKDSVIINEVSTTEPDEYPVLLRRLWLSIISMADDIIASAKKNQRGLKKAGQTEREINRISLYALRMLHMGVSSQVAISMVESRLVFALEVVGDAFMRSMKTKQVLVPAKLLDAAREFLQTAYHCWFKPSNKALNEMYSALTKVRSFRDDDRSSIVSSCELVAESITSRWSDIGILSKTI